MKITRLGRSRPLVNISTIGTDTGASGSVLTSSGSNGTTYWGPNVATITSNGSNLLTGPFVNVASGSNMVFSVTSNTLTIHSVQGAGQVSTINAILASASSNTALSTGVKGDLVVDFGCTIDQWTLLADQSGSVVVDIWKDSFGNAPPTVADSITGSAKPTITSAVKAQSGVLTGWTTTISAGDVLRYNVDSATTISQVTVALRVRRT